LRVKGKNEMKSCKVNTPIVKTSANAASCVDGYDNPFHMRYSAYEFFQAHAEWVLPRLKELRDHGIGCPASFIPCKDDTTEAEFHSGFKKWYIILTKMIRAFEAIAAEETDGYNGEHHPFVDEGLKLFHEYYFNLWD